MTDKEMKKLVEDILAGKVEPPNEKLKKLKDEYDAELIKLFKGESR